jgi:NADH dehydrogenase [ubiquinone] 1 alpha subcomplex assembly factor 5
MTQTAAQIFDRKLLLKNRARSIKKIAEADFLYNETAARMAEQFGFNIKKNFRTILEIGAKNSLIYDFLHKALKAPKYYVSDFSEQVLTQHKCPQKILFDEEILPIKKNSLDLVVSNLNLHTVNDLVGTLAQIKRTLKKNGLFFGSFFGAQTLKELRIALMEAEIELSNSASPRIHPFIDAQSGASLLQRVLFDEPTSSTETIQVKYENIFDLMHDLKNMGEGNIMLKRQKNIPNKKLFKLANEKFLQNNPSGLVTFEIIFLTGWVLK